MGASLCTHQHSDPSSQLLNQSGSAEATTATRSMSLVELLKPNCLRIEENNKKRGKSKRRSEHGVDTEELSVISTLEEFLLASPNFEPASPGRFHLCRQSSPKVCPVSSLSSYDHITSTTSSDQSSFNGRLVLGDEVATGCREERTMSLSRSQSGKKVSFRLPEADIYTFDCHDESDEGELQRTNNILD